MSSLWTPEGEHRVPRPDEGSPPHDAAPPTGLTGPDDGPDIAEQERLDEEMRSLERELAEAPVEDVIANHCYGLFQLAALHLGQNPPRLDAARLAIDAFAAVVEGLGDRLGPASQTLREGLAQIRLAFVQIQAAAVPASGAEPTPE